MPGSVSVETRVTRIGGEQNGIRLGLIGCGSIGSRVAEAVARGAVPDMRLAGLLDPLRPDAVRSVADAAACPACQDIASLLESQPHLVLEAASKDAVRTYACGVLDSGADIVVVSVGAFADVAFFNRLVEHARRKQRRVLIPSGAIGGVDLIKAAAIGGLQECRLTTTKPPAGLRTAPYIREQGIDLAGIRQATVIFEGTAAEAVRHFPQNLNVAVTVSLAGLGLEETKVRVIVDPGATHNTHEVFVRGAFGQATVRLENRPSLENPRTSALVVHSVIALLQSLRREFRLGT